MNETHQRKLLQHVMNAHDKRLKNVIQKSRAHVEYLTRFVEEGRAFNKEAQEYLKRRLFR